MKKEIKFYILGPKNNGDGSYNLLTEKGEVLAGHYCSSASFAKSDLEAGRSERQKIYYKRKKLKQEPNL